MYDIIMFTIAAICCLIILWAVYQLYEKCKRAKTVKEGFACVKTVIFTLLLSYAVSVVFTMYAPIAAKGVKTFVKDIP